MKILKPLILLFVVVLTTSCNTEPESVTVLEEPTERLIRDLKFQDFSVVLNDMNVKKEGDKNLFQHKYHILKVEQDSLVVDSLDWKTVNQPFFEKHEKDLGMEIVSKHNGTLSRVARPVGFDWAIGNENYGSWEEEKTVSTDSTSTQPHHTRRRWHSSGMSPLFWYWMLRRPTYRNDYQAYRASSSTGKAYYGTNGAGGTTYGTNSAYQKSKRPSFFSRKGASNAWRSFTKSKSSRSSSRYRGGSSTRSRSGGFGK